MQQELFLFRHGDIISKEKIFLGWINAPLNKNGLLQAKKVSKDLSRKKIDYGFCSDQLRSKQALGEVMKYHPKAKVIVDHRLRERHYGIFSGHSKALFKKLFPKKFEEIHRGYDTTIPCGENLFDVSKRVFPFMNDLLKFMQKEKCNVVISAHTNSLRLMQEYLEGLAKSEVVKKEHSPTQYKKYVISFL